MLTGILRGKAKGRGLKACHLWGFMGFAWQSPFFQALDIIEDLTNIPDLQESLRQGLRREEEYRVYTWEKATAPLCSPR